MSYTLHDVPTRVGAEAADMGTAEELGYLRSFSANR